MLGPTSKQGQSVGNHSIAVQSARDSIVYNGPTADEINSIVNALADPILRALASEVVNERMKDFENLSLKRLSEATNIPEGSFKDPDVLFQARQAQQTYARLAGSLDPDLLVELVLDRASTKGGSRTSLEINSALDTIQYLSIEEISVIFTIYYFRHIKHTTYTITQYFEYQERSPV